MFWKKKKAPLNQIHNKYFVQEVALTKSFEQRQRIDVFSEICRGKRVLHIGFVEGYEVSKLENNLHANLESFCLQLDGVDTDIKGMDALRPHLRGNMYTSINDARGTAYDVILVPEVLEHVGDAGAIRNFVCEANMTRRSMYAEQENDQGGCRGAVAADPQRAD